MDQSIGRVQGSSLWLVTPMAYLAEAAFAQHLVELKLVECQASGQRRTGVLLCGYLFCDINTSYVTT